MKITQEYSGDMEGGGANELYRDISNGHYELNNDRRTSNKSFLKSA